MTFKYKRNINDLEKLVKAQEAENSTFVPDDRFWFPERDKSGNGYAIIRFLPAPPQDGEEGLPWIQYFHHSFKGPTGQWYIENSLSTHTKENPKGLPDPVGELNSRLWNSSDDPNSPARKQVSAQKRKLTYVSNILVVKDPAHPENEGKVFLYKYGVKIYEKIKERLHPTIPGKVGINVFDPFEGANFEIIVKTIQFGEQAFPNYDASTFESPSSIVKKEEDFNEIWNTQYSLQELISPDKFKSYEELEKRLDAVLNQGDKKIKNTTKKTVVEEEEEEESPPFILDNDSSDNDDDDLKRFEALAKNL